MVPRRKERWAAMPKSRVTLALCALLVLIVLAWVLSTL